MNLVCEDCGHDLDNCQCLNESMIDHDYGHNGIDDIGSVVDSSTYIKQKPMMRQRYVKSMTADNPLEETAEDIHKRLLEDYSSFEGNWEIKLSKQAEKVLMKAGSYKKQILNLLDKVAKLDNPKSIGDDFENPSFKGLWKYRTGDWRIVAKINNNEHKIEILRIGDRKEIYRSLGESDEKRVNDDGLDSPLTYAERGFFDKDPFSGDEPETDGDNSPFSTIKRQKINK